MNGEHIKRFVHEGRITWTMTTIGYIRYREVPLALNGIAENL